MFSASQGMANVALPLLAVHVGYGRAVIGVLTALSAVTQLASRYLSGPAMRRYRDRSLVVASGAILALSCLVLTVSASLAAFVVAEFVQGVARGLFWTGTQTHAVRGTRPAVGSMAVINLVSSVGLLSGPALAGILVERSSSLALGLAALIAALGVPIGYGMDRLPPFSPREAGASRRMWTRPGVDIGCYCGLSAGAWRGILNSYVPVILARAGQASSTIGFLVSTANGASLAGSVAVGRLRGPGMRNTFLVGTAAAGIGIGVIGLTAHAAVMAGVGLALSGLGAGALQTVGPAIASDSVGEAERGDAIVAAGMFRAGALFVAPLTVAGVVAVLSLPVSLLLAGSLIALPLGTGLRRRPGLAARAADASSPAPPR